MANLAFSVQDPAPNLRVPNIVGAKIQAETVAKDQVAARVGFTPLAPKLPEVRLMKTQVHSAHQAYYGKFATGSAALYAYENDKQTIYIIQHPVLQSEFPLTFMYPKVHAKATLTSIRGVQAVVVRPIWPGLPLDPSVYMAPPGMFVQLVFWREAGEAVIMHVSESLG
jgi:hypothetical protein